MTNGWIRGRSGAAAVASMLAAVALLAWAGGGRPAVAADHGDAPSLAHDIAADVNDIYLFLDPNDNTRVVLIATFHGFIVPAEAVNFAIFDPALRYGFEIENTGDAEPDEFIDVSFSQRTTTAEAQTATVKLPFGGRRNRGKTFTAAATNPSLAGTPPAPVLTTDAETGVIFFAGETDDPFFFDIPGFGRFVASARAGTPDPTRLRRGRDSFAGYNTMAIALSIPAALLRGEDGLDEIGYDFLTQRRTESQTKTGEVRGRGKFRTVDRAGVPAVNVALIPFARKNVHNASDTEDDADGKFEADILATLDLFGTDDASRNIFLGLAGARGDFLRLNLSTANSGDGGGDNEGAGFPNGRRLRDDVIDIELTLINNRQALGDSVDVNDVAFRNEFPFLAPSQQPREGAGNVEDNTRN